ncbi:hypothetical protein M413DRAFT_446930 [Hebeloma cylindrosporum]|uniref:Uncharacterized protein n=1 Tax=Hebeloma cylindrosporum TaxID=76867 RepID=A0A0C2XP26_HEBCY|nr:hypothetical protein M413DRAFT_446930 [Hebeloma cylindrosporum h7]
MSMKSSQSIEGPTNTSTSSNYNPTVSDSWPAFTYAEGNFENYFELKILPNTDPP